MQTFQGFRQAFIVPHQAAKTRRPAKRAFNHPTTRQEHETFLGVGQLDNFQANALFGSRLSRVVTGIALVHKGDFDGLAGRLLNFLRQLRDLCAVLFIGGGHVQRQHMTQGIDRHVGLTTFAPFGPVIARSR